MLLSGAPTAEDSWRSGLTVMGIQHMNRAFLFLGCCRISFFWGGEGAGELLAAHSKGSLEWHIAEDKKPMKPHHISLPVSCFADSQRENPYMINCIFCA